MNETQLVELILQKVLERLPAAAIGEKPPSPTVIPERRALIFGEENCQYAKEAAISLGDCKTCFYQNGNYENEIHSFQHYIIPYLSRANIVHISIGLSTNKLEEAIIFSITQNKPLVLFHHELMEMKSCNPSFYSALEEHLERLAAYGISMRKTTAPKPEPPYTPPVAQLDLRGRMLVCEKDLAPAKTEDTVLIEPRAIITPAAKDMLRQKNLKIIQATA